MGQDRANTGQDVGQHRANIGDAHHQQQQEQQQPQHQHQHQQQQQQEQQEQQQQPQQRRQRRQRRRQQQRRGRQRRRQQSQQPPLVRSRALWLRLSVRRLTRLWLRCASQGSQPPPLGRMLPGCPTSRSPSCTGRGCSGPHRLSWILW